MNTAAEALPNDVAALHALLREAHAERDAERAEKAQLAAECDRLTGQNDRLRHLIRQLQRMQFGKRSEKLDPDQLNLGLEDLEQALAAEEADQERADPALRRSRAEKRRASRGSLPVICRGSRWSSSPKTARARAAAGRCTSSARTARSGST
jgi:transposase